MKLLEISKPNKDQKYDLRVVFLKNKDGKTPFKEDVETDDLIKAFVGESLVAMIWCNKTATTIDIEYSEVMDGWRNKGIYTNLLSLLSNDFSIISDEDMNNAAKNIYKRLGAQELRNGRFKLNKK